LKEAYTLLENTITESSYKSDLKYISKASLISTAEIHYKYGEYFKADDLSDIANDFITSIKLNTSKVTITKNKTITGKIEDMQTDCKRKFKASDLDSLFNVLFNDYYELHVYNKNTIKKDFKFIKRYFYYAGDTGIEVNPNLKKLSISGEDTKDTYLTLDELAITVDLDLKNNPLKHIQLTANQDTETELINNKKSIKLNLTAGEVYTITF